MDWENNFYLCQAFLKRCDDELLKIEEEIKECTSFFQSKKDHEKVLQTYLNSLNEDKKEYNNYNLLKEKREKLGTLRRGMIIAALICIFAAGITSSQIVFLLGGVTFITSMAFNIMSRNIKKLITSDKDFIDDSEDDYNEQIVLIQKEIEDNKKEMKKEIDKVDHLKKDKNVIMEGRSRMEEHIKRNFPYLSHDSLEKDPPVKREENPLIKINKYRNGRIH